MQFACVLSEDGKLTFQWVHHDLVQVLVLINMWSKSSELV